MSVPVIGDAILSDGLPWERLRARVRLVPGLYQVLPRSAGNCLVCRRPVGAGYARCFQCEEHAGLGRGLLADAVAPVSYAVRGTPFAKLLWQYKSWRDSDASIRTSLLAMLLVFLHDHGGCVWRAAGMAAPDRLAIVPSGCGRLGPHPLSRMVTPYLRLPVTSLELRPGLQGRDFDASRFVAAKIGAAKIGAADSVAGANVLLLDDTWVSGASIQSATAALKLAGAARVVAVVLGRYVTPVALPELMAGLGRADYDPAKCAICRNPPIA